MFSTLSKAIFVMNIFFLALSYVILSWLLRIYPENGAPFESGKIAGKAELSGKVGKHYVENDCKTAITIVLTEIKGAKSSEINKTEK